MRLACAILSFSKMKRCSPHTDAHMFWHELLKTLESVQAAITYDSISRSFWQRLAGTASQEWSLQLSERCSPRNEPSQPSKRPTLDVRQVVIMQRPTNIQASEQAFKS